MQKSNVGVVGGQAGFYQRLEEASSKGLPVCTVAYKTYAILSIKISACIMQTGVEI